MENKGNSIPIFMSVAMVILVSIIVSCGSCSISPNGVTMLSGDYAYTTLEHFTVTSNSTALISFSRKVEFPVLEYYVVGNDSWQSDNLSEILMAEKNENGVSLVGNVSVQEIEVIEKDAFMYELNFSHNTTLGESYILAGLVKDEYDSTLSFTLSFDGYNSRVPSMIFSEISTEYAGDRTEFIEFYMLEDGNLAGVILHSAGDGKNKDIILPSVEVKKGEYVVLHMRTVESGAVNEYGDNLALSNTKQSSSQGRDLWISGKETRLSKNDVLLLRKRLNGDLLDAIAYTDGIKTEWKKSEMLTYIKEATEADLWEGGADIFQVVDVETITGTRTLNRQNISEIERLFEQGQRHFPNSKDDWIIVATSNLSPGKPNSEKQHVK